MPEMSFPGMLMSKPVRRRGGQPGNLSAARHPWRVFWRRRALRVEDRWIAPVLEGYAEGLSADKGGAGSISNAEGRMIEVAQTARGATMLILAEAARRGFTIPGQDGKGWDLAPGAKELGRFLGLERQALDSLGLERRAKDVLDPFKEQELRFRRAIANQQAPTEGEGNG